MRGRISRLTILIHAIWARSWSRRLRGLRFCCSQVAGEIDAIGLVALGDGLHRLVDLRIGHRRGPAAWPPAAAASRRRSRAAPAAPAAGGSPRRWAGRWSPAPASSRSFRSWRGDHVVVDHRGDALRSRTGPATGDAGPRRRAAPARRARWRKARRKHAKMDDPSSSRPEQAAAGLELTESLEADPNQHGRLVAELGVRGQALLEADAPA